MRDSTRVAAFIGLGAGFAALAAVVLIRPPAPLDQMALPDRTRAEIARDFAKKVIADIAAIARPAPRATLDYDIEQVRLGARAVPHVFHAALPAELVDMRHAPERKDRFLMLVLPHVLKANEEIAAERARLLRIRTPMSAEDRVWLSWIADRYGTEDPAELARRIDVIPPSLALAQAAEESGWGTSRFAHEGNALFGQRTVAEEMGLVPLARTAAEGVRVRAYDSLGAAVRSYARNLNTHPAYAEFRRARAEARAKGTAPSGHSLAETLVRYSERGEAYVSSLRAIIRMNRLEGFDTARLGGSSI